MTQILSKLVTFEEFTVTKPEDGHYELHDGVIVKMAQPLGGHEDIVGFLAAEITLEYRRLNLPYSIPKTALVKPPEKDSGYSPDVLLLNRNNLASEPLWKNKSTVTQGASIPLVIEVVSTNWRDDYHKKYADYEEIGIPEYWVVDYLGLGAKKFTGNPKLPTISIYQLIDEEYHVTQFRGTNQIISRNFPELNLTAQQIFDAAL
jgi:Uma2 family endonuclease